MPSDAPGSDPLLTIDGLTPGNVLTPADAAETAALLADAANLRQAVIPVGSGTALSLGNPPARADIALSTRRLGGILDYEPVDLVISVGAGARLGDVQAVLAEHGQTLPLDPPGGDDATIGGLVATALTGPLRLSAGSLRDLLIGIQVAHPSGTVTKAGGMVVKNVSGFDLPRVYHGSLGTLGVITAANFKVLPLPRTEGSILLEGAFLADAVATAATLRQSNLAFAALEAGWRDDGAFVAARFTGRDPSVQAGLSATRAVMGSDARVLGRDESAAWWRSYQDELRLTIGEHEVLIRASVRPRETPALVAGIAAALPLAGATVTFLGAAAGLGTVIVRAEVADADADRPGQLQTALLGLASNVTILAAPPAWKRGLDVWGPAPESLGIMQALKDQFDPHRVLNPGRFVGGI